MRAPVKKINLFLPSEYVSRLDELAKKEYRTRSEVIRELVRTAIGEGERPSSHQRLHTWRHVKGIWAERKGLGREIHTWRRQIKHRLTPA